VLSENPMIRLDAWRMIRRRAAAAIAEAIATATAAALECAPGMHNIVDGDPTTQPIWLPAFARAVGAPPITEEGALAAFGPDTVYCATRLRGTSNEKAKRELSFRPRRLEWLEPAEPIE
jgi:2-alkyl-3-oxoalkanoate reductase